jgi:diketogulonate reductase-like aldo/keto reductase
MAPASDSSAVRSGGGARRCSSSARSCPRTLRRRAIAACERSLRRLGTDHLDLDLLHWRGTVPLAQIVAGFAGLLNAGWIRHWDVSNVDIADMTELLRVHGGKRVETDQVLYNLAHRAIEWDLLPLPFDGHADHGPSPIEQRRLASYPALTTIAAPHGATAAQIALAWVLRNEKLCAIPEAGTREHVVENRAALDLRLSEEDLVELDRVPTTTGGQPLEIILRRLIPLRRAGRDDMRRLWKVGVLLLTGERIEWETIRRERRRGRARSPTGQRSL